jgi:hypothetical protein
MNSSAAQRAPGPDFETRLRPRTLLGNRSGRRLLVPEQSRLSRSFRSCESLCLQKPPHCLVFVFNVTTSLSDHSCGGRTYLSIQTDTW